MSRHKWPLSRVEGFVVLMRRRGRGVARLSVGVCCTYHEVWCMCHWLWCGVGGRESGVLLRRNVKRFRGGLVFKAHRLVYHSTLGWRIIKKKKKKSGVRAAARRTALEPIRHTQGSHGQILATSFR